MDGRKYLLHNRRRLNKFFEQMNLKQERVDQDEFDDVDDESDYYTHNDYYEQRQRVLGHRGCDYYFNLYQ